MSSTVELRGDAASFDELYRRYADQATRVAYSVTRNHDDAADAVAEAFAALLQGMSSGRLDHVADVRAYLMVATRNAAIDVLRRAGRVVPIEEPEALAPPSGMAPSDRLLAGEDRALVREALAGLPPRWRAVLWLTEVEGMPAREVAELLDMTPNNAAQLAVRARSRLRQRYAQSHVRNHASGDCAWTADHLGGLAAGELTEQRAARVKGHLAECRECRARMDELDDLGLSVRRRAMPLALLFTRLRWPRRRSSAGWGSRGLGARAIDPSTVGAAFDLAGSPVGQQVAAAVTAVLLAVGVGAVAVRRDAPPDPPVLATPPSTVELAAPLPQPTVPTTVLLPPEPPPETTTTTSTVAAPPAAAAPRAPFVPRGPLARSTSATVAQAVVPVVAVRDAPGGTARLRLADPQPTGAPLTLLVTDRQGDWLEVLLPVRPNGSTGWIHSDDVTVSTHDYRIVIELDAHRITAYDGTGVILSEPVGVGTSDAPTPGGLYYTTALMRPADANGNLVVGGPYGPYAYVLSGFSEVIFDFAGGDGRFGIHGTNDPSGLGRDVSHGCIRMSNAGITKLASILPLGVPVEILP